jgi:uncharacterized short protein YbdD (DUF466 family)
MRELIQTFVTRASQSLRQMVGIPDYDAYVRHMRATHPGRACMTYEQFFQERQLSRYEGKTPGSRCC